MLPSYLSRKITAGYLQRRLQIKVGTTVEEIITNFTGGKSNQDLVFIIMQIGKRLKASLRK